jgi:hypothetical protein
MIDYTGILFWTPKSVPSVKIYIIRLALKIIIVLTVNSMIDNYIINIFIIYI